MTTNSESFFNLFNYHHREDGACDGIYIFEIVEIERFINTKLGRKLNKGDKFEAVWFNFTDATFHFITQWIPEEGGNWEDSNRVAREDSFIINQADIAPFLVWCDEDLPE